MRRPFADRIKRIKQQLKEASGTAAMLTSSSPERLKSRDQTFPFQQDPDFFYLTGSNSPELMLYISSKEKQPILFAPFVTKQQLLWEGSPPSYGALAQELGAELVQTKDPRTELLIKLRGVSKLYYQNVPGSKSWEICSFLMQIPSHRRGPLPISFTHCDSILAEARLYKDSYEIEMIRQAARITADSIQKAAHLMRPGSTEFEIAAAVEHGFRSSGADTAFSTIAATGKNAAVLHHRAGPTKLEENEVLLLDCGASFGGYSADLTRLFPVSGVLDETQAQIYEIVLCSSRAAIKKIKDGVKLKAVQDAAVRVLTEGLKDLGVLRGKTSNLIARGEYKKFFPHSIGHSLGIDVHDITTGGGKEGFVLRKGMVFTIEPGLYFPKKFRSIDASGYRIEDDILVTARGAEILSTASPTSIAEIESLLR